MARRLSPWGQPVPPQRAWPRCSEGCGRGTYGPWSLLLLMATLLLSRYVTNAYLRACVLKPKVFWR